MRINRKEKQMSIFEFLNSLRDLEEGLEIQANYLDVNIGDFFKEESSLLTLNLELALYLGGYEYSISHDELNISHDFSKELEKVKTFIKATKDKIKIDEEYEKLIESLD